MRLIFSSLLWALASFVSGQLPNSHADIPPHLEEHVICWFPLMDHFEDISGEPIVGIPSPSGLGFEATDDPGIPFQSYTSFSGGVVDLGSPERLMWPILKPGAFSVWFRPQGTGANGRLYSAENNECCGDIEFRASSSTAEAAAIVVNMLGMSTIISVPYEHWTHMVISANSIGTDSVQCSMYLNGDLYLEQSPAPANYDLPSYLPNGYDDMFIGQKAAPGWDKWGGDAAHMAWFDRGWTLDEINYLFSGNLSVGCTDPTAYNFDPEALQDDGSCIEFDIQVPLSCHVGNELECSALVSIASTFEPESIGGYDFIGSYSGSTYYLSQQPHSTPSGWAEQQNIAASFGGHLVDILSQGENDALVQLLDDFGWPPYIWLGLSDDGDEGNWTWSSGEPLEFTNWYPNEPNNCGGGCGQSNWGQLYTNGQWDDFGIGAHHCIIELPQQPTISWNNGEQGLTASYPDSIASIGATLIVDGVEVCTAFENVVMGQGCNDPAACNYNQSDECNVSCVYVAEGTDCELAISSLCGEGTIWDNESQTCVVTNPSDSNFDGSHNLG